MVFLPSTLEEEDSLEGVDAEEVVSSCDVDGSKDEELLCCDELDSDAEEGTLLEDEEEGAPHEARSPNAKRRGRCFFITTIC